MMLAVWGFALLVQAVAAAAPAPATSSERVEVVLFSDFQCPYCAQFAGPFRELQAKGVDDIETKVTFKHFPLPMHANAPLAHQAALAAGEQGKFWEMHDLLFANQSKVQRDDLGQYAARLGLDLERFRTDLDSAQNKAVIDADKAEGEKLGVSGTPTFLVNGKVYSGTRSYDQLKELIGGERRRTRALAEITEDLMSRGPADAPVTLELFTDLESPVSGPTVRVIDALMRRYPSTVRLQFRNFPLAFHPQAALAHEAAMTAALDGRFWEFASYVLDHQDSLREQDLIAYAGRLGLDEGRFADAIREHRYAPRVDADLQEGLKRGIRGSPVVFINGARIDGVPSLQALTDRVDALLTARETGGSKNR